MFGEKNSAAIYLERNAIVFAHPDKQILEKLPLDNSLINHLEVKNGEKFVQTVKDFFDQFSKESVVIFLSKPIIFEREIENDTKEDVKSVSPLDTFLSMVPIAKAKLGSKVLNSEASSLCLATNREYYELVSRSAGLSGLKVAGVVPAFLFEGLEGPEGLVAEAVSRALDDKEMLQKTNFVDGTEYGGDIIPNGDSVDESKQKTEGESRRSSTKNVVLVIVLVSLLSFSVIFSYINGLFDRFLPTKTVATPAPIVNTEPAPVVASSSGQEATASAIKMEDLRAKITNGTGNSGQAARAQDALQELKLRETLLNLEATKGAVITEIGYDPRVPLNLVQEVRVVLEKVFTKVKEKEASDTGEFDLLIITGTEKVVR